MSDKSINEHRLSTNPLESKFLKAWKECNNKYDGRDTIDYILSKNKDHHFPDIATDRDREVAATLIQWLGSPVGQNFIRSVLDNERR